MCVLAYRENVSSLSGDSFRNCAHHFREPYHLSKIKNALLPDGNVFNKSVTNNVANNNNEIKFNINIFAKLEIILIHCFQ